MKVSPRQYAQALYDLTEGKSESEIDSIIKKFLKNVKNNGQMRFSREIITQFEKIYNAANNIIAATVTTAFPLQNAQKDIMEKYIADEYDASNVVATYCEDKNIKGGVIIRVGDEVLDASVDGKLKLINNALHN